MFFYLNIIPIFYSILIIVLFYGWITLKTFDNSKNNFKYEKISVIIAFRNEQDNLPFIIDDLFNQKYPENSFEIIFVNDHSEDKSVEIVEKYLQKKSNSKLLSLNDEQKGKKNAIELGITDSFGNLIVTTDADCSVGNRWLRTINEFYQLNDAKMIVCPVLFQKEKKLVSFSNLQALEFLSLTATTAGSIGINKPLMCNGANLVYEKNIYLEFNDPTNKKIVSGDDTFLLFNVLRKYPKQIKYLKNVNAVVKTKASRNIKEFFYQRIRWASKSKYYSNLFVIVTGIIVFLMNFLLLIASVSVFFNINNVYYFLSLLLLKMIVDIPLLYFVSSFFKQQSLLINYLPLQFFYYFYISIIGFLSFFVTFKWKGRTFKK